MLIMAIDRNSTRLKLLERQLINLGHKVVAMAYKSGMGRLPEEPLPDAIVVSFNEHFDFDLLRAIKEKKAFYKVPVVILTLPDHESRAKAATRYGVNHYLIRPFYPDKLVEKLNQAMLFAGRRELSETIRKLKFISISAEIDLNTTLIEFRGLLQHDVLREAQALFNYAFKALTVKKRILFDIRDLSKLKLDDLKALENIFRMLESGSISLIAGRYLGRVLTKSDMAEKYGVFATYSEYRVFIKHRSRR